MKKILLILPKLLTVLLGSLLFSAPILANGADPSPETTRLLASQCAQCHGTTGNTRGDFDSVAGEDFQELLRELLSMKKDNDNDIMHIQIKGYTEQQIWHIADYYSRMQKQPAGEGVLPDSEGKNSEDNEDIELSEAEKKAIEAEKKAFEEAREAKKQEEEEKDEDEEEDEEDENND